MGFWAAAAPALVQAGTTVLGSIFGRKSAKKERAREEARQMTQFSRLREAAIAGGFNPLTVLRATGGAGFGSAGVSVPSIGEGIMASASFLGDALGAGMNWKADEAARGLALEGQALQNDLARLQLSAARGAGAGWSVPVYENKASPVQIGGPALGAPGGSQPGGFWPALTGAFSSTFTDATQGVGAMVTDALGMADRNASLVTGENMSRDQRRGQDAWIDFGRFVYDDVILGFGSKVQDWREFSGRVGASIRDGRRVDGRAAVAALSDTWRNATTGPGAAMPSGWAYLPGNQEFAFPQLRLPSLAPSAGGSMSDRSLRDRSPAFSRVQDSWRAWRDSKGY